MTRRREQVIVDTNVPICANGLSDQVGADCVIACVERLLQITEEGMLVLDASGEVFQEYQHYLAYSGQPGVGDVFFRWLFQNQGNRTRVRHVSITRDLPNDTYMEFPHDPDLDGFDRSDRKFVAVAIAAGAKRRPTISNATDGDWVEFAEPLGRHGVRIEQLCPEHQSRR